MTFAPIETSIDSSGNIAWNVFTAFSTWNTKWEASDITIDCEIRNSLEIYISFYTAWAPPIGVYEKMLNEDIIIESKYYEDGAGFFGKCEFNNGNFRYIQYDYPKNKTELEELRTEIGIYGELDQFMSTTWEELDDEWSEIPDIIQEST
jgi:hypothetical protein